MDERIALRFAEHQEAAGAALEHLAGRIRLAADLLIASYRAAIGSKKKAPAFAPSLTDTMPL
jgi:hypothetical protein